MSHGIKRHFLVVAATSRCARLFIKKALLDGHNVTALCRASDDQHALLRMHEVLDQTTISNHQKPEKQNLGVLRASNGDILEPNTYAQLIKDDTSIDGLCCFVGTTSLRQAMSPFTRIYTDTIAAILDGMSQSRSVELFYHSSVGVGGTPADAMNYWPQNYPTVSFLIPWFFPVFRDVVHSERLFERNGDIQSAYITFRPGSLKDHSARGNYQALIDLSKTSPHSAELSSMKTSIGREDVADEMLRVATLPLREREVLHGHSLYLADKL